MAFVLDATLKLKFRGITEFQNKLAAAIKNATTTANATGITSLNQQLDKTVTSAGNSATAVGKASKAQGELSKESDKASKSVAGASKNMADGTKKAQSFGEGVALAGTRYLRFVAATALPLAGIAALGAATSAALEFEQQLLKLDQVLNPTRERFDELRGVILDLSTETGVAAGEIAEAARILAQAGALTEGVDLRAALEDLARVPLLPTFAGIEQATEGILAFSNQFGLSIDQTGEILEKLNAVSKQFAVESSDLIEAAKRGGSAFKAFGGDIDEFIAIVTVLRQTTRESASSIGTALKTISARIIRPKNIAELQAFGIATKDANGALLNSIDILRNVAAVFNTLTTAQQRQLAETLGGFRQIGKVVAALGDNFELFDKALNVSRNSAGTLASDTNKALATVGGQLGILRAELNEFIQQLAGPVILPILQNLTSLARAITSIGTAFGPAIAAAASFGAVLTGIIALKASPALLGFVGNLVGSLTGGTAAAGAAGAAAAGAGGVVAGGAAAATGGVRGAAAAAVRSGAGQLAILAALNAGFGQLVDSSDSLNDEQKQLVRRIAVVGSSFLALNAILAKQTLGQSLGSLSGALIGAATIAAVGFGVAINEVGQQSVKETTEAIQQISNKLSNSFKNIDTAGAADITEQAVFALNQSVASALTATEVVDLKTAVGEFVGRFNNAFESFGQGEFIEGIRRLFTDAFPKDKVTSEITQGFFDNTEIFSTAVAEAVRTGGVNFQKRLRESLDLDLPDAEVNKKIANAIKAIGSLEKVLDTAKLNESKSKLEQTIRDLSTTIPSEIFPASLFVDIEVFSNAFSKAVKSIQEGNKQFDRLIGRRVTEFETDIVPKTEKSKVLEELSTQGLDNLVSQLSSLGIPIVKATEDALKDVKIAQDFAEQIAGALAKSGNLTEKNATDLLTTFLKVNKIGGPLATTLQDIKEDILQTLQEGKPLRREEIRKIVLVQVPLAEAADILVDALVEGNNAFAGKINRGAKANAEFLESTIKNLPVTQIVGRFKELAALAGITLPLGASFESFGDGVDKTKVAFENINKILDNSGEISSLVTARVKERIDAEDELRNRLKEGNIAQDDFNRDIQVAAKATRDAQASLILFLDILKKGPEAINESANAEKKRLNNLTKASEAVTPELRRIDNERRKIELQRLKDLAGTKDAELAVNIELKKSADERSNRLAKLTEDVSNLNQTLDRLRIDRAVEAGDIFKPLTDAGNIIKIAVENFDKAVVRLLTDTARATGTGRGPLAISPLSDEQRITAISIGLFGKGLDELTAEFEAQKERLRQGRFTAGAPGGGAGLGLAPPETLVEAGAINAIARRITDELGDPALFDKVKSQLFTTLTGGFAPVLVQLQKTAQGIQQERIQQQLTAGEGQNEARAEVQAATAVARELATTVSNSIDKIGPTITNAISELFGGDDRSREGTEELEEAVDVLGTNTDINTKALEKATTDQGTQSAALGKSLSAATTAMDGLKEGVNVQLTATQDLSVKVSLDESLRSLEPQLKTVMVAIARDEMRQAVEGLLSNTNDPDRQKEINDTLQGLG